MNLKLFRIDGPGRKRNKCSSPIGVEAGPHRRSGKHGTIKMQKEDMQKQIAVNINSTRKRKQEDVKPVHVSFLATRESADTPIVLHRLYRSDDNTEGPDVKPLLNKINLDIPGAYVNFVKLWETGDVETMYAVKFGKGTKKEKEQYERLRQESNGAARTLVAQRYRTEFPERSKYLQDFVDSTVQELSKMAAWPLPDGASPSLPNDRFLLGALQAQEEKFLKTGKGGAYFGWVLPNRLFALVELGFTEGKYSEAVAVSEIAEKVNASHILYIGDMWVRDAKTGERNGHEGVQGSLISSNGTVVSSGMGVYKRKQSKTSTPRFNVIEPVTISTERGKQYLFPAWKHVPAQSIAA